MRLIDAEALKYRFAQITYIRFTADMGQGGFEMFSEKEIEDIIDKAPAVENQRPRGEWIEVDIKPTPYGGYTCNRKCKRCNYFTKEYRLNFCPNCGADMRGGAE